MPGVFVPSAKVGSSSFTADGGEMMLSPSWICSEYPESATVTSSSGNRRNGTGKPHERATQTLVGAPSRGNHEPNGWIGLRD